MKRFSILILIGLLFSAPLLAQDTIPEKDKPEVDESKRRQKPLRVGLGLIGAGYVGDLNNNGQELFRFHPGVNISLQFASPKLITPQINAGFGKFVAQDREIGEVEGIQPNTFVETSFFWADFRLKVRFLRKHAFNPHISIGIGLLGFTPRDQDGNSLLDNFATRKDDEATYGSITAAFPMSAGFDWKLNPILAIGLEYTHRFTGTDYLDNIGQLGTREGNDRLNTLMLNLYITFDPENPINFNNLKGRDRRDEF